MLNKKNMYPVDDRGGMITYDYGWIPDDKWKPMEEFEATMRYVGHEQGRSALRLKLMDGLGRHWSLMASSMDMFIKQSKDGMLTGIWKPVKRGVNFGLILVEVKP